MRRQFQDVVLARIEFEMRRRRRECDRRGRDKIRCAPTERGRRRAAMRRDERRVDQEEEARERDG